MQGARILRNEAYFSYAAMTKDEAQSACGGQMDFLGSRQNWLDTWDSKFIMNVFHDWAYAVTLEESAVACH